MHNNHGGTRVAWRGLRVSLLFTLLSALSGCTAEPSGEMPLTPATFPAPPDRGEVRHYAARPIAGDPPADGFRYWQRPLYRLPYGGCYVTLLNRGTGAAPQLELWQNTWGDEAATRTLSVRRGASLADLGPMALACTGELIDDVFIPAGPRTLEPKEPKTLAPLRGYTRPHLILDDEYGLVALACVCPDYKPGSVSLMPALLTSPTGEPGTWTYHGRLRGEPQEEEAKRGRPIWSDGGTLLRLADGRWRIYLNNFPPAAITFLESETLTGPWRFHRNDAGEIQDLLPPNEEGKRRANCFPHVLRVSESEWHLWYSDRWPVQSIWHFTSRDGITWEPYGRQPEITRAAVGGYGIKCIRTFLSDDRKTINGLLSVWGTDPESGRGHWQLHLLRMPAGRRP